MTPVDIGLTIPGMLAEAIGTSRRLSVRAATLDGAIARIKADYPKLAAHVFDDLGKLRRHVLIFLNEESITWMKDLNVLIKPGDQLSIVQAVSGGWM